MQLSGIVSHTTFIESQDTMILYHELQSIMALELNQLQNWLLHQYELYSCFAMLKYPLSYDLNEDVRFELLPMLPRHVCYHYTTPSIEIASTPT